MLICFKYGTPVRIPRCCIMLSASPYTRLSLRSQLLSIQDIQHVFSLANIVKVYTEQVGQASSEVSWSPDACSESYVSWLLWMIDLAPKDVM